MILLYLLVGAFAFLAVRSILEVRKSVRAYSRILEQRNAPPQH